MTLLQDLRAKGSNRLKYLLSSVMGCLLLWNKPMTSKR